MTDRSLRTVADYSAAARKLLPRDLWDTLLGDYGDVQWRTNTNNIDGFRSVTLRPRILADVRSLRTTTTVLGSPAVSPVLIAPSGGHQRYHPEGELATVRAASRCRTVTVLSTVATFSIEEVAAAAQAAPLWFQLYLLRDRRVTQRLVRRSEDSGYRAIVVTVDVPGTKTNERDARFARRGYDFANESAIAPHLDPRRVLKNFQDPELVDFELPTPAGLPAYFDSTFTWRDLETLRAMTTLPIVIKGVQRAEDAELCREHGMDGLVVSNHGGFALPDARASVSVLPEVVDAAGGVEVYVDGGVRTGADVLKCLALGARAVLVGRPQIWGLAVGGEDGVAGVLEILAGELEQAMRHCGCADITDLPPGLVAGARRGSGLADGLAVVADLFERGLLDGDEFRAAKQRLLAGA